MQQRAHLLLLRPPDHSIIRTLQTHAPAATINYFTSRQALDGFFAELSK
jgi:hypothetical protein